MYITCFSSYRNYMKTIQETTSITKMYMKTTISTKRSTNSRTCADHAHDRKEKAELSRSTLRDQLGFALPFPALREIS